MAAARNNQAGRRPETPAPVAAPEPAPVAATAATEETPEEALEALKARLAAAESRAAKSEEKLRKAGLSDEIEAGVRMRMSLGLTRDQATEAEIRQQAHNAVLRTKYRDTSHKQTALIVASMNGRALTADEARDATPATTGAIEEQTTEAEDRDAAAAKAKEKKD